MNKWLKLLVAALVVISAAIQARQFQYADAHTAVPIATIVLQLVLLVLLGGNEIRNASAGTGGADRIGGRV